MTATGTRTVARSGDVGRGRVGADLVVETLRLAGVEAAFGVPGVHALALWEAMRVNDLRCIGMRTELAAAFAADGYARTSGRPAALMLSTGPGALIALAGLMEAASSYVPMIAITSAVDRRLAGRGRGALHELSDQLASFRPVVKWSRTALTAESIPALVCEAWEAAVTPPGGPAFLEIPVDLLEGKTDVPPPTTPVPAPSRDTGVRGDLGRACELLEAAAEPVIFAGGGVARAGAWEVLTALAERIDAPVLTTYMGKGSIPDDHPLSGGSACDEEPFKEALRTADVVLCVGSELGEEPTSAYTTRFDGAVVQVDASATRIGTTHPALPLVGDAGTVLRELAALLPHRDTDSGGRQRVKRLRAAVEASLREPDRELERSRLASIRRALPVTAVHAWDMTVLGYWAARDFPAGAPRRFLYPVGSGTLGYAWPAAIGASLADPDAPVLAVAGDGGVMYAIQELVSARQAGVATSLLIVDDGGYGILREYQHRAFGATHGVELARPDFVALAAACGVPARATSPATLERDVRWSLAIDQPSVLVLEEVLRPPARMH